jgi:hypothetical protein
MRDSEGSNKISIMLEVGLPSPETKKEEYLPVANKRPLEDKVREMLELIDSGYDSDVEFIAIKRLYKELCCKKPSERVNNLKKMIEPVLAKYGYHVGNRED